MGLLDLPVHDVRPSLVEERAELVSLLGSLDDAAWVTSTEAGRWRVKDVALHLLDDDLGWLSRGRDDDRSGLLPTAGDYRDFVRALDAKNERWVRGASGLSRRVVADLLAWSGDQVAAYYASLDLEADSNVIWASGSAVPRWFDLCRDLTERWVHQQHIRDAVGQPGDHHRFLPTVLGTFVWAFPHQYEAVADDGTTVALELGGGGTWHLLRTGTTWELRSGVAAAPAASLSMASEVAWRQLTGLPVAADLIELQGPHSLTRPLLAVRGIIA